MDFPDIKESNIYGNLLAVSSYMRVVQCTRCRTVQYTSARKNRPQCSRAIAISLGMHNNVATCNGPMISTGTVCCPHCKEWSDVTTLDANLGCPWCGLGMKLKSTVSNPMTGP